ncbi:MAG TPA: molybdopterin-dependent oxidoreductase [Candidatus Methylomirabilis sp.]|nr:molybdopterin-dependent oxidoreductase [Candidatus Methylomirabilis sp.]
MLPHQSPQQSALPVELVINGRKVAARPGQTILDVVREGQLDEIPTLCHDPRLQPYGSCFLCVVEVKGSPRLLPACVTRVRDGMEVTTRSERITHVRKRALALLLSDHYADCVCPGQLACPAGVDVQGYISLARLGYYHEALALIRERNPLPVVCGRVCVRKCELQCRRNAVDEPVGINFIKRYVSQHGDGREARSSPVAHTGKRVAIVGGGPAGLTCANYLALDGHSVTIFEALPALGGMLRYGIPEYRLPRAELDEEIDRILGLGVQVMSGRKLGRDFTLESLIQRDKFDAVFLAVGAPLGKKLGVPGEEVAEGVLSALDFLRQVELQGPPRLSGKVAVVGGGNSAIDAARTALRCEADEVVILYRRTRKEMPAHHEEVEAAEKEGVQLEMLVAPVAILAREGRLTGVRCIRMALGEPDASGRRTPVPIPGSEFDSACDFLLPAIGQDADLATFQDEPDRTRPAISRRTTLEVDPSTLATNLAGVFAGGDVVSGPSAVIDAVAHGRMAADAIDRYLRTGKVTGAPPPFVSRREVFGPLADWLFEGVKHATRQRMPERDPRERTKDFGQVELGLSEPQLKDETIRCMECGCKSVFSCELKRYATEYQVDMSRFAGAVRKHRVDASHPLITLDPNKCILCGRCVRACADLVGLSVLGFVGRGFGTQVGPALGRPLAESPCIACGACVETCPTGALESRLPYGRQGPWKSRRYPSICGFCSLGCRLDVHIVSDGLLWASSPVDSTDSGDLCLKGRFGTGLIHGADRLRQPLVRRDGRLVEADWDEAIHQAAAVLLECRNQEGPATLAVLAGARMTLEECFLTRHLARTALGAGQTGSFGQHRRGGPRHDLDGILGETASTCVREDIDAADLVLLVGADPGVTHPVLAMAIRRAAKRGAEIAAINSSKIDLIHSGDLWLDARRGTAGIILAGAIRRIFQHGQIQQSILDGGQGGLEALYRSVTDAAMEEVAAISGVEGSKIEALVERLAGRRRIVAIYDLDDTLERSVDDLIALTQLLWLTGHLGKPGEGLLLLQSDCNSEGARLAGIAGVLTPGTMRGALVIGENPFGDPDSRHLLERLRWIVAIDHCLTETAKAAQVVLPGATLVESEGTLVSFDRRVRGISRASQPVAGLGTADVLARLARELGHPVRSTDPARIRVELAGQLGLAPDHLERARDRGEIWPMRRDRNRPLRPRAVRLDSAAMTADVYPYASLDAHVARRLVEMGVPRP